MIKLNYEKFQGIYQDQANEEGYEKYTDIVNRIAADLKDVDDINEINTDSLLTLKYLRFRQYLNPKFINIKERLDQFSDFAPNDPLYESLTNFKGFFIEHLDVAENYEKKRKEMVQFVIDSNLPKEIENKTKNFVLEKMFDDERTVKAIMELNVDEYKDEMTKVISLYLRKKDT